MDEIKGIDSGTLQYEIFFNEDETRWCSSATATPTPNAKMKEQLGKGGPKLFTPWMAF